jgi:hypothetical protein
MRTKRRVAGTPELLDVDFVAKDLRKAKLTLRNWRALGRGPPYVLIGKTPWYPREPYLAWKSQLELHGVAV